MRLLFLYVSFFIPIVSFAQQPKQFVAGKWKFILLLNDETVLPFEVDFTSNAAITEAYFINDSEKLKAESVIFKDDSVFIRTAIFDSEFKGKISEGSSLQGFWYNNSRGSNYEIPFKASSCSSCDRFDKSKKNTADVSGKWEVHFSPNTESFHKAIGIFRQDNGNVSGTFLTETGDYRYLEGTTANDSLYLSCFDGSHAFLFKSKLVNDSIMTGMFWSGSHWEEPWFATRNEKAQLRHPDSLTWLTGSKRFYFSFPGLDGKIVSSADPRFRNKVMLVQLMGSWCPNCMDETAFLSALYEQYNSKGLEIVALAFETTSDTAVAAKNVKRLKEHFNANYTFLLTGKTGKKGAADALPALNNVLSFPTTVFIDRKGNVRKIYTGFSGPATGKAYDDFKKETISLIDKMLNEP